MHRTARGVEVGTETPSGSRGVMASLVAAIDTAWQVRDTLWVLVLKEFKLRYRAQALGFFWSFANPLIMMGTLTIVFTRILRIQTPNFPIFYLIGAILWQFFNNGLLAGTGAMIDNAPLVKRTTFPRFLLPVAAVLSHLVNLAFECVILVVFAFIMPEAFHLSASIVVLPVLIAIELLMLIGFVLATAPLNVRYRDVYYLVTSALTIGFWISPIIYSLDMVPEWIRPFIALNPLAGVMTGARDVIMRGAWPAARDIVPGAITAIVVFLCGAAIFRRQDLELADHV